MDLGESSPPELLYPCPAAISMLLFPVQPDRVGLGLGDWGLGLSCLGGRIRGTGTLGDIDRVKKGPL